jgi:hypothetical protein
MQWSGHHAGPKEPPIRMGFRKESAECVDIDEAQGNPYRPDVNYRGFMPRRIPELPQGISVFPNGARVNAPFDDIVFSTSVKSAS